jgi:hypothetical protein
MTELMAELNGNGCYIARYADDSSVLENGKLSQKCYESIPLQGSLGIILDEGFVQNLKVTVG